MSGFQLASGFVVGANNADSTDDVDGYNIAAKYSANGLYLAASIGKVQNDSLGETEDRDTWGLAATYTIDALKLVATYEDRESDALDADAINLAAIYNLGNGLSVKARYAEKDIDGAADEQSNWTAEVEQKLGQGRVYASYWAFDSEAETAGGEADALILGYRVDF